MRARGFAVGAATVGLILGTATAVPAEADAEFALNGAYRVVSNGNFAKTNEVYMKERTVDSVWTFSSSCTNAHECTGEVTSDQGWSAPLEFRTTRWIVDRFHENWQTCPDGTTSPGRQRYQFQGSDANGQYEKTNIDHLVGYDRTIGVSGACGRNTPTVITMPMDLRRL
ncbi:hypothetical protein H7J77_16240 [Mycolicibacillus parakoreensis]|uniref:Secreted protein n=1 Tax=Mycolicibacillus parakoreensis TaxID=1069221 RepID=A0ABY3TUU2_9MYCO|nr:hypothetical protein [Mycolicibacillus parakoreensis]MCV7317089.1 hypothetical protein [Mycolicibacillus parakoreensis]ULN51413.1 hypothetical protein MIU77_10835 [Mycolicibacillus parakoreensis]